MPYVHCAQFEIVDQSPGHGGQERLHLDLVNGAYHSTKNTYILNRRVCSNLVLTGMSTVLGGDLSSSSTLCSGATHLHSLSGEGTAALDLPRAVSDGVQGQTSGDLMQQSWTGLTDYITVCCCCVCVCVCVCARTHTHTASTLAAVGRSCLFAKIITGTPFSFSSSRRAASSSAVSSKRFVSVLSMM